MCLPKKPLLLKLYSEIYRQHRLKHFPYRQGINNFVSASLQLHWHWPFNNALSLENRHHSCHMNALLVSHPCETLGVQLRASMPVPCQREVDWRQGTSLDFIAFCLRYVHPFYAANFSAVKTEGLPPVAPNSATFTTIAKGQYTLVPHLTCLAKCELLLLGQAEPTMVGIVVA